MRRLFAVLVLACLAAGCSEKPAPVSPVPQGVELVATVNGRPLTKLELELRLKGGGHARGEVEPPVRAEALQALIDAELMAQQAVALKLDADPEYRAAMAQVDAQAAELKRRELARLFERKEIAEKTKVSDAEAKAWFDAHQQRIATEVRVSQLLRRGKAELEPLKQRLDAGEAFDDVAASLFPGQPAGVKPWQLGFLAWQQVPEAWWPALDALQPGQVSGILEGPGGRAWIIRLDERRPNEKMTFELAKPGIVAALRAQALGALRDDTLKALRTNAQILRPAGP